ncbi:MAG: hypothetical protein Q9168_005664 [Polycauliona sp. 1 TL-2023]
MRIKRPPLKKKALGTSRVLTDLRRADTGTKKHIKNWIGRVDDNTESHHYAGEAERSPFEKLSPELRAMVFKQLLVEPAPISMKVNWLDSPPTTWLGLRVSNHHPSTVCQLFAVSKMFYEEASTIYFGKNTFHCKEVEAVHEFLSRLNFDYRRRIRSLSFVFESSDTPVRSLEYLQRCVSLLKLEITVSIDTLREYGNGDSVSDPEDRIEFPDFEELIKVRGIHNLKINMPTVIYSGIPWLDDMVNPDLFVKKLQVVKQPQSIEWLKLQDEKDFSPEKRGDQYMTKPSSNPFRSRM